MPFVIKIRMQLINQSINGCLKLSKNQNRFENQFEFRRIEESRGQVEVCVNLPNRLSWLTLHCLALPQHLQLSSASSFAALIFCVIQKSLIIVSVQNWRNAFLTNLLYPLPHLFYQPYFTEFMWAIQSLWHDVELMN